MNFVNKNSRNAVITQFFHFGVLCDRGVLALNPLQLFDCYRFVRDYPCGGAVRDDEAG